MPDKEKANDTTDKAFKSLQSNLAGVPKLSDERMRKMIPVFVDDKSEADHKCGSCAMRIPIGEDAGQCTVVRGDISLRRGSCTAWGKGPASKKSERHDRQMSKSASGYVEVRRDDDLINCGSCTFFKSAKNYCELWEGSSDPRQCCQYWENWETTVHESGGLEEVPYVR